MAHTAVINAFPRRPISLVQAKDGGKSGRIALIVILLLFLPGLYWGYSLWQDQNLREFLRTSGVEAQVLSSEGSCWSRRQITGDEPRGCNLDIQYQLRPEHGGQVRQADVWLDGRQPIFRPPALYDPADPSRVMLKPEAERDLRWTEWIAAPILLLFPIAGLLLWIFGSKGGLEDALRDPRPVTVPVERFVRGPTGLQVWFRKPEGGKELLQVFAHGKTPLLLNPPADDPSDRPWALAVLSPRGRPLLLDSDLGNLELTDQERAAILGDAPPASTG